MTDLDREGARLREALPDGPSLAELDRRVARRRRRRQARTAVTVLVVVAAVASSWLVSRAMKGTSVSVTGGPSPGASAVPTMPPSPIPSPAAGGAAPPPSRSSLLPGQVLQLTSIQMFGTDGWATTSSGAGCHLLRTTDGAQTFTDVTPSSAEAGCTAFFLDAEHAWVTGLGPTGESLLATTNGGATWASSAWPDQTSADPRLDFVNTLDGWIEGAGEPSQENQQQPVSFWSTTDGGKRWSLANQSPTPSGPYLFPSPAAGQLPLNCGKQGGISFVSARTGWMAGGCLGAGAAGVTFEGTHDGGASWYPQPLPAPPGGFGCDAGPCELSAPVFTTSADGTMVLSDMPSGTTTARSTLYVTTDGGTNWSPRALPPGATGVSFALAPRGGVSFLMGGQEGWCPAGEYLFATTDGGASWKRLALLPSPGSLDFVDAEHGYLLSAASGSGIVAISPGLYATSDGGRTWTPVSPHLAG
jgi:photosystem II stability/assembly factor-like uncharacterized protein